MHIRRLRNRLGGDLRHPRILISVRGLGYRLDPP
ncbi:helix-turn-helix domain-containing protein [Actinoplanes sp. TRM88002]|uniref:Helix-turn-helix domain-containing protein n=1 Tax=Paractinoplanes hotanensis TaxID=2906497 RepID=A0ABT0YAR6_9ACTN|nr:helix-turn-helix domain-containing protein [Actinoplanes hotanensis]